MTVSLSLPRCNSFDGGTAFDFDRYSSFPALRRPRPNRWCWTSRPDLGERWPSRLVATAAAEKRLNIRRRNPQHVVRGSQRLPETSARLHARRLSAATPRIALLAATARELQDDDRPLLRPHRRDTLA